jgi:hypothetical protein
MWVQGDIDAEQRYIYTQNKKNHVSQQWDIIYADQWKRDPIKGELNPRFGMYVEYHSSLSHSYLQESTLILLVEDRL